MCTHFHSGVHAPWPVLGYLRISTGLSRQCGQCLRPDCPVSSPDVGAREAGSTWDMLEQPFASSEMGDSMDLDLLPGKHG